MLSELGPEQPPIERNQIISLKRDITEAPHAEMGNQHSLGGEGCHH